MADVSQKLYDKLVAGLLENDAQCIGQIYDAYSDALYGIVFRILKDEEEAADCLQEVFVRIWKNRLQFNPEKGRLFTWMSRIARNTAINVMNSKGFSQRTKIQSSSDAVYNSGKHYSLSVETLDLKGLVSRLEEKYLVIIDLLYFQGFTQQEASDHLNIPLGTVKTRVKGALKQLRKNYSEQLIILMFCGMHLFNSISIL